MAGQWPGDTDCPITFLIEVAFRERGIREPCGEPSVYARPEGFHGVVREGRSTGCIRVKHAEARVEADPGQRDGHLAGKNGIKII